MELGGLGVSADPMQMQKQILSLDLGSVPSVLNQPCTKKKRGPIVMRITVAMQCESRRGDRWLGSGHV